MAGRKHHYIQRMLLKGFSFDSSQNPCHIWVYRKDGKIFAPALEGYGAERDFYGAPDHSDLDARITRLESGRFNKFLCELREGYERVVDSGSAAAFAVHVFFRSKNLRSMLSAGIQGLTDRVLAALRDPGTLEQLVASGIRKNLGPTLQVLDKFGIKVTSAMVESSSVPLARLFITKNRLQIDSYLANIGPSVNQLVSAAHRKSMNERLHDFRGPRMKQLKAMRWHLLIVGQGLVLGDSVVFAELANGSFKPVSEPGDALKRVWIPIAHDRVLAGSESDEAIPHDTLFINQGAASCSFDSFCSREGPPKHKSLIPLVRTATFSLDEAQSEIIMKELLAKAMF